MGSYTEEMIDEAIASKASPRFTAIEMPVPGEKSGAFVMDSESEEPFCLISCSPFAFARAQLIADLLNQGNALEHIEQ